MARSVLIVFALLSVSTPRQEPRVVERRFTSELELATESFGLTGTEDGRTEEQRPPRYVREQADEAELTDTLLDDEDPPARFTRHYRTVVSSFRLGAEESPRERTASAGLEGKTVSFERQEDGTYARSCADADVRAGQLGRLRLDVSLACFLPAESGEDGEDEDDDGEAALAPGANWEIPSANLVRLISPLEEGVRRPRKRSSALPGGLNVAPAALAEPMTSLLAAAQGTTTATLVARSEDDELPCNARLEFRLASTFDGAESLLAGLMEDSDAAAEDELELVYEGTGTLAWDPETGRIELACRGELRMRETFSVRVEAGGKTAVVEGKLALSGTLALDAHEQRGG